MPEHISDQIMADRDSSTSGLIIYAFLHNLIQIYVKVDEAAVDYFSYDYFHRASNRQKTTPQGSQHMSGYVWFHINSVKSNK